jgi:ABC-type dipeptide/oligopeptide/nickel transport system ATPase subunit
MNHKALVLFAGGQDAATCLARALECRTQVLAEPHRQVPACVQHTSH